MERLTEALAMGSGSFGRNFYRRLSESRRRGASPSRAPRIWISLKRVAARSIGYCVGKRRLVVRLLKRVARISVCLKMKVARMGRGGGATTSVLTSYDAHSYSQNFDDGRWQKEDEEFYRRRSFSSRFVGLPMQSSGL